MKKFILAIVAVASISAIPNQSNALDGISGGINFSIGSGGGYGPSDFSCHKESRYSRNNQVEPYSCLTVHNGQQEFEAFAVSNIIGLKTTPAKLNALVAEACEYGVNAEYISEADYKKLSNKKKDTNYFVHDKNQKVVLFKRADAPNNCPTSSSFPNQIQEVHEEDGGVDETRVLTGGNKCSIVEKNAEVLAALLKSKIGAPLSTLGQYAAFMKLANEYGLPLLIDSTGTADDLLKPKLGFGVSSKPNKDRVYISNTQNFVIILNKSTKKISQIALPATPKGCWMENGYSAFGGGGISIGFPGSGSTGVGGGLNLR